MPDTEPKVRVQKVTHFITFGNVGARVLERKTVEAISLECRYEDNLELQNALERQGYKYVDAVVVARLGERFYRIRAEKEL